MMDHWKIGLPKFNYSDNSALRAQRALLLFQTLEKIQVGQFTKTPWEWQLYCRNDL